jgi:hypothetical protein
MGRPEMKKTSGHWGLSGPGWAAEWNMGGASGFLSIAAGGDDDRAQVTRSVEIPVSGRYFVWVRYGDWREKTERFQVRIEQNGSPPWNAEYGARAMVEEDNEMKLYWGWTFVWDQRPARLQKGPARIRLLTTVKENQPRQVDVVVLTTDPAYRPQIKERPRHSTWDLLATYRRSLPADLEPLARRRDLRDLPPQWRLPTFNNRGLLYLWNVNPDGGWLSDQPNRVKFPYHIGDEATRKEFEARYGDRDDVPIFSDPRIVPTFHGVGPGIFATDAKTGELTEPGRRFARWLEAHPQRPWAMMMNYHGGVPVGPRGLQTFQKFRDRFVGSIAGESLGYFDLEPAALRQAVSAATSRRQLVEAFAPLSLAANAAKYRKIYGRDLDANPYQDVISCLSIGNIAFVPLCALWGSRTIGYESSAVTSTMLGMRWGFLRGAARQNGNLTATYRSCNFGDSATIFSNTGSFHTPQNILDNYYSVYSGAGMTWYKMENRLTGEFMTGSITRERRLPHGK